MKIGIADCSYNYAKQKYLSISCKTKFAFNMRILLMYVVNDDHPVTLLLFVLPQEDEDYIIIIICSCCGNTLKIIILLQGHLCQLHSFINPNPDHQIEIPVNSTYFNEKFSLIKHSLVTLSTKLALLLTRSINCYSTRVTHSLQLDTCACISSLLRSLQLRHS